MSDILPDDWRYAARAAKVDGQDARYLMRQYRPAYFRDCDNDVLRSVAYDNILKAPWLANFKADGFTEFKIEPYGNGELIISAYYANGQHWVAGFALPEDSEVMAADGGLLRDNWRYRPHKS